MTKFEFYMPVVTLLIGWLLNELSGIFRFRGEKKKAASMVLANLVLIRNQFAVSHFATSFFNPDMGPAGTEFLKLKDGIESLRYNPEELRKKYDQTLDILTTFDPLTATVLRNQDQILSYFKALEKIDDSEAFDNVRVLYGNVTNRLVLTIFDEAIKKLSLRHGFITRFKIKHMLIPKGRFADEVEKIIEDIKKASHNKSLHSDR